LNAGRLDSITPNNWIDGFARESRLLFRRGMNRLRTEQRGILIFTPRLLAAITRASSAKERFKSVWTRSFRQLNKCNFIRLIRTVPVSFLAAPGREKLGWHLRIRVLPPIYLPSVAHGSVPLNINRQKRPSATALQHAGDHRESAARSNLSNAGTPR
jgi:hypothetical protein